jgi:hypothetical protein
MFSLSLLPSQVLNEGFDESGPSASTQQHNPSSRLRSLSDLDILAESRRIVTLIDLAGHEKYFKTTVFGLVSHSPLCCVLTIAAGSASMAAPHHMTLEHLGVAYVLNVPLLIVITKADQCSPEGLQQTIDFVSRLLRSFRKEALVVNCDTDLETLLAADSASCDGDEQPQVNAKAGVAAPIPVFVTSAVTGGGIQELRRYLFRLSVPAASPATSSPQGPIKNKEEGEGQGEGEGGVVHTEVRVLGAFRADWAKETSAVFDGGSGCVEDGSAECSQRDGPRGGDVIIEGTVSGGDGLAVGEDVSISFILLFRVITCLIVLSCAAVLRTFPGRVLLHCHYSQHTHQPRSGADDMSRTNLHCMHK